LRAARRLVAVVRQIVRKVRGASVALDERAVTLITEVARAQPGCAPLLVGGAGGVKGVEHRGNVTSLVERALREPRVEMHADPTEVFSKPFDDALIAPLGRLCERHVVPGIAMETAGHLDQVLPAVAVLGRLFAPVARVQRLPERLELVAAVVEL